MDNRQLINSITNNGVKVISEYVPSSKSVALGFWIDAGSRDETRPLWGCSHFLEHLLFKGTKKRDANEISNSIESRGGYLNAFTDRDMTCYHAKVVERDIETAVDVLSDIVQNPLLREEDIKKELHVVLSEINSRDDDPQDLIHDLYTVTTWGENSAAHPIIGDESTLRKMTNDQISSYYKESYTPKNLVVTAAGAVDHTHLVRLVEQYVTFQREFIKRSRESPLFKSFRSYTERKSSQAQLAITFKGQTSESKGKDALNLINSYLGVGASSKLFQEVREKQGLVYSIYTSNLSLKDAGLFNIFAGAIENNLVKVVETSMREISSLHDGTSDFDLNSIKEKTIGFYLLRSESTDSRMMQLGASYLRNGKVKSVDDVVSEIMDVSESQIQKIAKTFEKNKTAITILGASEDTRKKIDSILD
jgi:predicted Zn-dependent peptidase